MSEIRDGAEGLGENPERMMKFDGIVFPLRPIAHDTIEILGKA